MSGRGDSGSGRRYTPGEYVRRDADSGRRYTPGEYVCRDGVNYQANQSGNLERVGAPGYYGGDDPDASSDAWRGGSRWHSDSGTRESYPGYPGQRNAAGGEFTYTYYDGSGNPRRGQAENVRYYTDNPHGRPLATYRRPSERQDESSSSDEEDTSNLPPGVHTTAPARGYPQGYQHCYGQRNNYMGLWNENRRQWIQRR